MKYLCKHKGPEYRIVVVENMFENFKILSYSMSLNPQLIQLINFHLSYYSENVKQGDTL